MHFVLTNISSSKLNVANQTLDLGASISVNAENIDASLAALMKSGLVSVTPPVSTTEIDAIGTSTGTGDVYELKLMAILAQREIRFKDASLSSPAGSTVNAEVRIVDGTGTISLIENSKTVTVGFSGSPGDATIVTAQPVHFTAGRVIVQVRKPTPGIVTLSLTDSGVTGLTVTDTLPITFS